MSPPHPFRPVWALAVVRPLTVDLRLAGRLVAGGPLGALAVVVVLATLMGAATGLFSLYHGARYRAYDVADVDRLFSTALSYPDWQEVAPQLRAFSEMGIGVPGPGVSSETGETFSIASITRGWLEAVRPTFVVGRGFSRADFDAKKKLVIISHQLWQQRFGGRADIVGQVFSKNGPILIAGVLSPGFVYPTFHDQPTQLWFLADDDQLLPLLRRMGTAARAPIALRAAPGINLATARQEFERLVAAAFARHPPGPQTLPSLTAFAQSEFEDECGVLRDALIAALVFLTVGCANLGTLLLSRILRRRREQVVSLALGAWPARLLHLHLLVCALLALAGGLLGGLVAAPLMALAKRHYVSAAANPGFLQAGFNQPTLLFGAAVIAAVTLLIALPSALSLAGGAIHASLKDSARTHSGSRATRRWRETLLALQVALAALLLLASGTAAMGISLQLSGQGFDARNVAYVRVEFPSEELRKAQIAFRSQVLARLTALPGIEAAGLASPEPFATGSAANMVLITEAGGQPTGAIRRVTGGDLWGTLRIPLLRGRRFAPDHDPQKGHEVVVEESFGKLVLGGKEPLGRQVRLDAEEEPFTIVGVVANSKSLALPGEGGFSTLYLPHRESTSDHSVTFLARSPRDPAQLAAEMRRIVLEIEPRQRIVASGPFSEVPLHAVADDLAQLALTGSFGLLALLLTALGLHSAAVALVVSRTNELGVRLAIGASPGGILALVLRQGLRPVVAGLVLCGLALAISLKIPSFRALVIGYDRPLDWRWGTAALALITSATVLALLVPAWRASRMSPQAALRAE